MQHVLNIAFDFDDERVKTIAENAIQNNIDDIVKNIVLDHIAPEEYSYYSRSKERNYKFLRQKVEERIDIVLKDHQEEIIEQAAKQLYESVRRTKAWKERYLKEIDNG